MNKNMGDDKLSFITPSFLVYYRSFSIGINV